VLPPRERRCPTRGLGVEGTQEPRHRLPSEREEGSLVAGPRRSRLLHDQVRRSAPCDLAYLSQSCALACHPALAAPTRTFGAKKQNIGRERQARPLSRAQRGDASLHRNPRRKVRAVPPRPDMRPNAARSRSIPLWNGAGGMPRAQTSRLDIFASEPGKPSDVSQVAHAKRRAFTHVCCGYWAEG
jgi:hypothetical protein